MALGLPRGSFAHVEGGDLSEATHARNMNRVLYSSTLGYFLDQIMSPLVGADAVNEVGEYFSRWVIPRGFVSAFRVGRVPYGVLAATSLVRWQDEPAATPVQARMTQFLRKLRPIWLDAVAQAPHIRTGGDPDQDLIDVLSMDASARQVRVRKVIGNETWQNLFALLDAPSAFWNAIAQTTGEAALAAAGIDPAIRSRAEDMTYSADGKLYDGPLVDTSAVSEISTLGERDYISWIRGATIDQLRAEVLPPTIPATIKQALLYRFLRHGALAEYHWWGNQILARYATTQVPIWSEPELVAIIPGTEAVQTPWQRLQSYVTLPAIGTIALAALYDGDYETELRGLTGVGEFRDALGGVGAPPDRRARAAIHRVTRRRVPPHRRLDRVAGQSSPDAAATTPQPRIGLLCRRVRLAGEPRTRDVHDGHSTQRSDRA